ncbi:hypothetical protein F2Q70_00044603 [Brassica cretica]|uniref:Uncharacterized protein n=1 Tax=Brassica cretica TaxID=69181 RepID=A0A8S9KH86_BRACR|nr:hypothetical protein F2Q70_00044603 [Brassica cretica]
MRGEERSRGDARRPASRNGDSKDASIAVPERKSRANSTFYMDTKAVFNIIKQTIELVEYTKAVGTATWIQKLYSERKESFV